MTILSYGSSFSFAIEREKPQVVLVLINHLSFADGPIYKNTVGYQSLEKNAAVGIMNVNTAGTRTDANEYLTLGGGTRGASSRDIGDSLMGWERFENRKDKAADIYHQQTGIKVTDERILFLSLQRLLQESERKFPFSFGVTGELLKQTGHTARVYGNQDTVTYKRYAALLIMDNQGQSSGDIGESTVTSDVARPFGIKTNYDYIYQRFSQDLDDGVSLVVIDLGDLYRLDQFKKQMSPSQYEGIRKAVIQEQGQFLDRLMQHLQDNQQLFVLAPMVSDQAIQDRQILAPIWWYQPGRTAHSLISGTTKREGMVSNIDVIPTVLSQLGIKNLPSEMIGREIKPMIGNLSLDQQLDQTFTVYRQRPMILYSYVFWQVTILILSITVWLIRWKKAYLFTRVSLLSMLYLPLLFLVSSPLYRIPMWGFLLISFLASMILPLLMKSVDTVRLFTIISLLTWAGITLDVSMGAPLMKKSYLGYDPIIGARYYGIGNEYMGVYIGATLLFTSAWIQQWRNRWTLGLVALVYGGTSYLLLSPTLGTNAGGAIAALVATSLTFLKMNNIRIARKGLWIFLLLVALGLFLLVWVNLMITAEEQSHIGRAINALKTGDFASIYQLISRKLAMNWKLIRVSSWSKVMIASLFAIGILFAKPWGTLKTFYAQFSFLFYGFYGIVMGAITALLVNDSGIVAASTMIIFVASPMLYLALEEK